MICELAPGGSDVNNSHVEAGRAKIRIIKLHVLVPKFPDAEKKISPGTSYRR